MKLVEGKDNRLFEHPVRACLTRIDLGHDQSADLLIELQMQCAVPTTSHFLISFITNVAPVLNPEAPGFRDARDGHLPCSTLHRRRLTIDSNNEYS